MSAVALAEFPGAQPLPGAIEPLGSDEAAQSKADRWLRTRLGLAVREALLSCLDQGSDAWLGTEIGRAVVEALGEAMGVDFLVPARTPCCSCPFPPGSPSRITTLTRRVELRQRTDHHKDCVVQSGRSAPLAILGNGRLGRFEFDPAVIDDQEWAFPGDAIGKLRTRRTPRIRKVAQIAGKELGEY